MRKLIKNMILAGNNIFLKIGINFGFQLNYPFEVCVRPTEKCNLLCKMCYQRNVKKQDELDINVLKKFVNSISYFTETVSISGGGDPLCYKNIVELVGLIKERDFKCYLITNGVLLNRSMAENFSDLGLDMVLLSLDAINKDQYIKTKGVDFFDKVRENIKILSGIDNRPRLILKFVIQSTNYRDIQKMFDLAYDLNVDEVLFSKIYGNNKDAVLTDKMKDYILSQKYEQGIKSNLNQFLRYLKGVEIPKKCFRPHSFMEIETNGDVIPCCKVNYPLGNIKDQTFRQIWFGSNYKKIRNSFLKGNLFNICKTDCEPEWIENNKRLSKF